MGRLTDNVTSQIKLALNGRINLNSNGFLYNVTFRTYPTFFTW